MRDRVSDGAGTHLYPRSSPVMRPRVSSRLRRRRSFSSASSHRRHFAIRKGRSVEACGFFGVVVKPEANRIFRLRGHQVSLIVWNKKSDERGSVKVARGAVRRLVLSFSAGGQNRRIGPLAQPPRRALLLGARIKRDV